MKKKSTKKSLSQEFSGIFFTSKELDGDLKTKIDNFHSISSHEDRVWNEGPPKIRTPWRRNPELGTPNIRTNPISIFSNIFHNRYVFLRVL